MTEKNKSNNKSPKAGETVAVEDENKVAGDDDVETVESLRKENSKLNDLYLRRLAEFENYKKRQSRIFDEMVCAARDSLVLKILEVLDNFERAIESGDTPEDVDSIVGGIHLIHKQLQDILVSENIESVCRKGDCFDPNLHEAVGTVPSDAKEDTVVEVVQKGYKIGNRLVRPARVLVAVPENETPNDKS